MMKIKAVLVLFFLVLALVTAGAQPKVKVGVLVPLSGELTSFGQLMLASVKEADLNGIELIVEDDECVPAKTIAAFKKLKDLDRVQFILGPVCGSPQRSLAPQLKTFDLVSMLLGSGAENLFEVSGGRVFSPQYSNEDEATYNAHLMTQLGLKRVAMIFYEDVFCRAHEKAFRNAFQGEVVESFSYSNFDPIVLRPILAKLRRLKVDGIYVPDVSPFLLGLRKEMAKLGMSQIPVVSIYSAQSKDLLSAEGSYADGLIYSYPQVDDTEAVGYFAKQGADFLFNAIRNCAGSSTCVKEELLQKHGFNERGVLTGPIETRVIREGKFVRTSVAEIAGVLAAK